MKKFTIRHNILSKKAEELNINNFPGVDIQKDPCLSYDFILYNLNLVHQHFITPLMNAFSGDISITSAYRSMELNKAIGGNPMSQHVSGYAIDIVSMKFPTSLLYNWCFQNLPSWNQLIWEYPEKGMYHQNNPNFSWIHISWVLDNNPKTSSLSSNREDIHEMYKSENTKRIGNYTHKIAFANENLL